MLRIALLGYIPVLIVVSSITYPTLLQSLATSVFGSFESNTSQQLFSLYALLLGIDYLVYLAAARSFRKNTIRDYHRQQSQ